MLVCPDCRYAQEGSGDRLEVCPRCAVRDKQAYLVSVDPVPGGRGSLVGLFSAARAELAKARERGHGISRPRGGSS